MVYTKLLFNNIKNYTPKAIKTIPYSQAAKQSLVIKANQQYLLNQTPVVKSMYRFIKRWAYGSVPGQIFLYYGLAYLITQMIWQPILMVYQSNNAHRTLDRAIEIENAYKKKMEEEEEDDDEEDDEEDDDEEEEDDE